MEWIKELSDKFVIWLLRKTSSFGKELTGAGQAEQLLWREQRLRNLKGLAMRYQQRHSKKVSK
ncbi:MAG TPA: hypothetical protein VF353_03540 [Candidatus Binatia bacterium]|jgi:hypothetical protein